MSRLLIPLTSILLGVASAGCPSSADGDSTGAGGAPAWLTASCSSLGGTLTPAGGCYVACTSDSDCPGGSRCSTGEASYYDESRWTRHYCRMEGNGCAGEQACGPSGWVCASTHCYLRCGTNSGGAQSPQCPTGYQCENHGAAERTWCAGYLGGSCGEPCSAGCCSPSGLICCAPPFCGGECSYSRCCR